MYPVTHQTVQPHCDFFKIQLKFHKDYSYLMAKASDGNVELDVAYNFYIDKKAKCKDLVSAVSREYNIPIYLLALMHQGAVFNAESDRTLESLEERSHFSTPFYLFKSGNFAGGFLTRLDLESLQELRRVSRFNQTIQDCLTRKGHSVREAIELIFKRFLYFKMNSQGTFEDKTYSIKVIEDETVYYRYQKKDSMVTDNMWLSERIYLSKGEAQEQLAVKDEWNDFSSLSEVKLLPGAWLVQSQSRAQGRLGGGARQFLLYTDDPFNEGKFEMRQLTDKPFMAKTND